MPTFTTAFTGCLVTVLLTIFGACFTPLTVRYAYTTCCTPGTPSETVVRDPTYDSDPTARWWRSRSGPACVSCVPVMRSTVMFSPSVGKEAGSGCAVSWPASVTPAWLSACATVCAVVSIGIERPSTSDVDVPLGPDLEAQALAADRLVAVHRQVRVRAVQAQIAQRLVHGRRGGPDLLVLAVDADVELAAVADRDLLAVRPGVPGGRGHLVVAVGGDALGLEDVGDLAVERVDGAFLAVHRHVDGLLEADVGSGGADESQQDRALDGADLGLGTLAVPAGGTSTAHADPDLVVSGYDAGLFEAFEDPFSIASIRLPRRH